MPKGKAPAGSASIPRTPQKKQSKKLEGSPQKQNSPKGVGRTTQSPSKVKNGGTKSEEVPEAKKERAAVLRSTIPDNLGAWLPANYVQLVTSSKNRDEWRAKVKWLLAVLFFRCRFFAPTTIRSILQALQPTDSQVLISTTADNIAFFKGLILQLHDRIWEPHAQIAKIFLCDTPAGISYLHDYQKRSEAHRVRAKMTADGLELSLSLTTNDVRGLWTAIEYSAHSECWTSTSKSTRIYIEALRHASYGLMARIINHWLRRAKHPTDLSFDTHIRVQDFQSTSDINNPPSWPKAPSKGDRPSSLEEWLECPRNYPSALKNPLFLILKARIGRNTDEGQTTGKAGKPGSSEQKELIDVDSGGSSDTDDSLTDLNSEDSFEYNELALKFAEQSRTDSQPSIQGLFQNEKREMEIDSLNGSPDHQILSHVHTGRYLARERSPSPTFSAIPRGMRNTDVPHHSLSITTGPSPMFQSALGVPEDLEARALPEVNMNIVAETQARDREERLRFLGFLRDECMDDEWYETSEAAYVASLSSIGKAEYAMQCLNRDLERWSHAIWALNQRKLHDEQRMVDLAEKRQQAIQRQRLLSDLETAGVSTNEATMQIVRSHRLRDQHDAHKRNHAKYTHPSQNPYSESLGYQYSGTTSSPRVSTVPAQFTTSVQRPASIQRQSSAFGMSSSPAGCLRETYSHPDSSFDMRPVSRTSYGPPNNENTGEGYMGPLGHDSQYPLTFNRPSIPTGSPGPVGLGPVGLGPNTSEYSEERKKRKLERRTKREAKRAKIFGPQTKPVDRPHHPNPADDEYYAHPYREVPRSHHDSDYTGMATSDTATTKDPTPITPRIGGPRVGTPGAKNPVPAPEVSQLINTNIAQIPDSQPANYKDFSSAFNPQIRKTSQPGQTTIFSPQPQGGVTGQPIFIDQDNNAITANAPTPGQSEQSTHLQPGPAAT